MIVLEEKEFESDKITLGLEKDEIEEINNRNENKKENKFIKSVFEWIDSFIVSFIAVVLIFTIFVGKVRVQGDSMNETLHEDDQLIVSDFCYNPQRGDIVIVSRNSENIVASEFESNLQPIVKRVIAVGGDTIEVTEDGKVLLNDVEIDEPYIKDYAQNLGTPQEDMTVKLEVPEGRIFVMGDNRHNSRDSRSKYVWLVDKRYVLGKVLFRIYPFEQFEWFENPEVYN